MNQISMTYEHRLYNPEYSHWTSVRNDIALPKVTEWVYKHCAGKLTMGRTFLYFEHEADALLFKLSFNQV